MGQKRPVDVYLLVTTDTFEERLLETLADKRDLAMAALDPESDVCDMGVLTLKEIEISHIRAALESCSWNVSRAAKRLGIDRSTLTRKVKRYQIQRP